MVGDKLIFLDEHREKVNKIMLDLSFIRPPKKFIICIGGCSGVGKTEIAYLLRHRLKNESGLGCKIISLDDYYMTSWKNRRTTRKETDNIGCDEINWIEIKLAIKHFQQDEPFEVQLIDKYTDEVDTLVTDGKSDVLIIEGLYALYIDGYYKVHINGHYDSTKEFRNQRNKEKQDGFRDYVLQREQECMDILSNKYNLKI